MRKARRKDKPAPWPVFVPVHRPRDPGQTDAQYAAGRRQTELHYQSLSIWLGMAQQLATVLGWHRGCKRGGCRRARRCEGRYGQEDWSIAFGPFLPPCVSREPEVLDRFRAIIRAEMRHIIETGAAASDEPSPEGGGSPARSTSVPCSRRSGG